MSNTKFELGQIVTTVGARSVLGGGDVSALSEDQYLSRVAELIARHHKGDWGDVGPEDAKSNDKALESGARVFSSYNVNDDKLWVITEAEDDEGVRNSTCVLHPSEY